MGSTHLPALVELDLSKISLALLVLGCYICGIGQVSYVLKERAFLSSALLTLLLGVAFGPIGTGWIDPLEWSGGNEGIRNGLTFQLCRLVIGIQVLFAGISLPAAYLKTQAQSLVILLLPIMTFAWFITAGLIFAFIPGLTYLEALCISACATPTDPILANSIVKGRFAEKHVPKAVRDIVSAESGANDGLGYPFLFLPIYLMDRGDLSVGASIKEWVISTIIYEIGLSCVLGALIGYIARKTLKEAHRRHLIDHESFLAYGIGLAFLTLGLVGILGADDVLACFVVGNSLTWQDFYRLENEDETFQDVIDSLLNAAIFIYLGALLPWAEFGNGTIGLSAWRLIVLGILVLTVRRLPWVMAWYPLIPSLDSWREAVFAGYFGPIGISAVYYAILAVERLPEPRERLREVIYPVVLFLALTSTVAHGITIPVARFTPHIYRRTRSSISVASEGAGDFLKSFRRANNAGAALTNRRGFAADDGAESGTDDSGTVTRAGTVQSTPTVQRRGNGVSSNGVDIGLERLEGKRVAVQDTAERAPGVQTGVGCAEI